jgi:hypothetical protein
MHFSYIFNEYNSGPYISPILSLKMLGLEKYTKFIWYLNSIYLYFIDLHIPKTITVKINMLKKI